MQTSRLLWCYTQPLVQSQCKQSHQNHQPVCRKTAFCAFAMAIATACSRKSNTTCCKNLQRRSRNSQPVVQKRTVPKQSCSTVTHVVQKRKLQQKKRYHEVAFLCFCVVLLWVRFANSSNVFSCKFLQKSNPCLQTTVLVQQF